MSNFGEKLGTSISNLFKSKMKQKTNSKEEMK
jgi:hypothetical protein